MDAIFVEPTVMRTHIVPLALRPEQQEVLDDAMLSATKIYNGLLFHLRAQYEQTGTSVISRKALNPVLQSLPRKNHLHANTGQEIRDEVIRSYKSFFQLRANGRTEHEAPGFRRKTHRSTLTLYPGKGFRIEGSNTLVVSFGLSRPDKVKQIKVRLKLHSRVKWSRILQVRISYDAKHGYQAHLVCEVKAEAKPGSRRVALDLGETMVMAAVFEGGDSLLYSGREIKSERRYWQKVRSHVKPPAEKQKKSRRYSQIDRKESRRINHWLHILSKQFVAECVCRGVGEIAVGDLTGIREHIDYGARLNQRLHAWPFAKLLSYITYKAKKHGINVILVSERETSRACHGCKVVKKANRRTRGQYLCACGWHKHADLNGAANIFERAFDVSPFQGSSGRVARPVASWRLDRHWVHAPRPESRPTQLAA